MGGRRARPAIQGKTYLHLHFLVAGILSMLTGVVHIPVSFAWMCSPKALIYISACRTPLKDSSSMQGLEKYGVGRWGEISTQLLPRWDDQTLRVKASKLLGSQSLARYVGWQGDR